MLSQKNHITFEGMTNLPQLLTTVCSEQIYRKDVDTMNNLNNVDTINGYASQKTREIRDYLLLVATNNLLIHLNDDRISSDVLENFRTMTLKKIKELHPFKITPPTEKNPRWQTYALSPTGEKKKIRGNTEEELYEKLRIFYSEDENTTLEDFFETWLQKKILATNSMGTIRRHVQHWKKYYLNSPIIKIPLRKLTKSDIEDFLHRTIKEFNLSKTELNNMKIILKGALALAEEKGIISKNPFPSVQINYKLCRYVQKKSNKTQIYQAHEKEILYQYLDEDFKENPDITNTLAIRLLLQLGVRIGELVALKWSDIEDDYIHIQRMESKDQHLEKDLYFSPATYQIVEYAKGKNSNGDRFLYLTPTAKDILKKVKAINERMGYDDRHFIFVNEDGRINSRAIAYRIEKVCNQAGLPVKSAHDMRRTVASELNANGVPLDEIRRILGHSNEQTTLSYIFNPYSDQKTNELIEQALH